MLSVDMKIATLLKNKKAVEVINKYMHGVAERPEIHLVEEMSLRAFAAFPQTNISKDDLEMCNTELAKIEID